MRVILFSFFLICAFSFTPFSLLAEIEDVWSEAKGKHFILEYKDSSIEKAWINKVLKEAENYYHVIATKLGYSRYDNYWTWEQRARIRIYPDKNTFLKETEQPNWAQGGSIRDYKLFTSRMIITYLHEDGFLTSFLPHEIAHMILWDYIGVKNDIPLWFGEGVAQLYEKEMITQANKIMCGFVRQNKYYSIFDLMKKDIRLENDEVKIAIFYAQSLSLVSFLIEKYGENNFRELCFHLRQNNGFETAIKNAYKNSIKDLAELEINWLEFIQNYR